MTYRRATKTRVNATGCLLAFFAVFAAVGLIGAASFVPSARRTLAARTTWRETSCRIESARITESPGDDGASYRPEFVFTLADARGRVHRITGFDGWNVSIGSRETARALLARYPVGSDTPCWHDPDDPDNAVISRDFRAAWLTLVLPMLFGVVGLGEIAFALRSGALERQRRAEAASRGWPSWVPGAPRARPGKRLRFALVPAAPASGGLAALASLALVWNVIVAIPLVYLLDEREGGGASTRAKILVGALAFVGLALLVATVRLAMARLGAGKLVVEASARDLRLGESFEVLLLASGGRRVEMLEIWLVCEEITHRADGDGTSTARATVVDLPIASRERVSSSGPSTEIAARAGIPEDAMPSFSAPHNELSWFLLLRVHGRGPVVERRFPLRVLAPGAT